MTGFDLALVASVSVAVSCFAALPLLKLNNLTMDCVKHLTDLYDCQQERIETLEAELERVHKTYTTPLSQLLRDDNDN